MKFMTGHIIACCNDIFSASREMKNGDVNNSVVILHYRLDISLEEAIVRVVDIHNQAVKTMLDLEKSLPDFGEKVNTEVTKYISGMYAWIRSNHDWYSRTSRYENLERLELKSNQNLIKAS
jgi:5-epi-alpha-selinene synthase